MYKSLLVILTLLSMVLSADRTTAKMGSPGSPSPLSFKPFRYEIVTKWNKAVDDLDSLFDGRIDTLRSTVVSIDSIYSIQATIDTVTGNTRFLGSPVVDKSLTTDTLKFTNNVRGRALQGLVRSSIVTIGHPGETGTDIAFDSAANTTEQSLGADTIPANARILECVMFTTEAVAGITTSFAVDIGDGAGTDEYATSADVKAANAILSSAVGGTPYVAPSSSAVIIFVNGTPDAENWDAMTAGEFTLITTYVDYGSVK